MRRAHAGFFSLCVLLSAMIPAPAPAIDWTYLYVLVAEIEQSLEAQAAERMVEEPTPASSTEGRETSRTDKLDEGALAWSEIKARFDRICGKIQIAPDLSVEEVEGLIEECEVLRRALEQSDEPQAKVLLKRLKMCQDFFEYSLEAR